MRNTRPAPRVPTIEDVLASPCTSRWLKEALRACLKRDPVDALGDAEALVALLHARLSNMSHP